MDDDDGGEAFVHAYAAASFFLFSKHSKRLIIICIYIYIFEGCFKKSKVKACDSMVVVVHEFSVTTFLACHQVIQDFLFMSR